MEGRGYRLRQPVRSLLWGLAVALVACAPGVDPEAGAAEHWTDGDFDEWLVESARVSAVRDPMGDVPAGAVVDLHRVSLADDPRFVHLLLDVGSRVTAQGMTGSVEIVLDVDGDQESGASVGGVDGADLVVVLSPPGREGPRGTGVGIRRVGAATGAGPLESSYAVGLLISPTHWSDRFEVRLTRGAVAGSDGQVLAGRRGEQVRGVVRYLLDGEAVDETPSFGHTVRTAPRENRRRAEAAPVGQTDGTLRVVVWNVSSESFRDRSEAFRRVLEALAPDVVLLDEVHGDVTDEFLDAFFVAGGSTRAGEWSWWLGRGGGRQRTVVAAFGYGLAGEPELERVGYGAGELRQWAEAAGGSSELLEFAEQERAAGMSATGAWVEAAGRWILFVPVDLQSAGDDGSPQDRLRELQARILNREITRVLDRVPDAGLVVGGDINLVGSDQPLAELRRGLGADEADLAVARPERLTDRSLATWRSTGLADAFSPGRLDYVLYRESALSVDKAFVFDAAELSSGARRRLGVDEEDTWASDHLPIVVDFRVR